jgi:glycosyltransferase involved in cell wall biosynthesis
VLIEAVRSSRHEPRVQLVILGDGPLRDRLRALASSLTNSAVFDCLPAPELIPYYTDADLHVHTAEVEVEGMAVLEAMGCGLPCLIATSPTSATAQFARSAPFRFPAGSSKALTASIDHWIEHPDELAAARADHSEAARNYHIDTSVDRLLGVYQKVLSRTDPSAT